MSRNASSAFVTALAAKEIRPAIFFEGQFVGGFLRLWSGTADITWDGKFWTGAGTLLGIGAVEETTSIVASGLTITLSGVPPDVVSACISAARQGLPGQVWVALMTEGGAVVADPVLAFAGRLDVPTIADGQDSAIATITYESRLIDLTRPREWRYTDESQKALYPGDRGFEYVTALQEQEITWGNA
jgi:hypothetical protein